VTSAEMSIYKLCKNTIILQNSVFGSANRVKTWYSLRVFPIIKLYQKI